MARPAKKVSEANRLAAEMAVKEMMADAILQGLPIPFPTERERADATRSIELWLQEKEDAGIVPERVAHITHEPMQEPRISQWVEEMICREDREEREIRDLMHVDRDRCHVRLDWTDRVSQPSEYATVECTIPTTDGTDRYWAESIWIRANGRCRRVLRRVPCPEDAC